MNQVDVEVTPRNGPSILELTCPQVLLLAAKVGGLPQAVGLTTIFCNFARDRAPYGGIALYSEEQIEQVLTLSGCPPNTMKDLIEVGILGKDEQGRFEAKISHWSPEPVMHSFLRRTYFQEV